MKFLILVLLAAPVWAEPAPKAADLNSLVQIALKENPKILSAREHWKSLMAQVPAAATWNDPVIGFQRMNFQGGQNGNYWSVAQNVPFPGKLSEAATMARHEAMIAFEQYNALALDISAQVAIEYNRIFWLQETSAILQKDSAILREIAQVAKASVASGRTTTDEALSAQAAFIKIKNASKEREQESLIEEESLNVLLNQPAGTAWDLKDPGEPQKIDQTPKELEALAKKTNPEYAAALHEILHAKAALALTRFGFLPDFQFSASQEIAPYVPTMQESVYGVNLSIPLWFWKQESLIDSAKAHRKEAEASSQEAVNEILRQVRSELIEVNLRRDLALSYQREIIPLTKSAFKITEKGYEAGQASFAKLSEDVRALLDAELKYPEEVELYGEHLAKLKRAVGGAMDQGESKP